MTPFLRRIVVAVTASMLVALCPFARSASAQGICYQENGGPSFNDGVFAGPNGCLAVRVVMPESVTATGLQVFTGEVVGTARILLWSHDAGLDAPGALLASGLFTTALAKGFQGASFSSPVALQAQATYWIAWSLPFVAQSSIDSAKMTLGQFYRTSLDGGATWLGPFQFPTGHHKFRLEGTCGPSAGYTVAYGTGCGGATLPTLLGGGVPSGGHVLALRVADGPASAAGLFTLGLGQGTVGVLGCLAQNLPLGAQFPVALDSAGELTLAAALPPGLPALDLYFQMYFLDPSAAVGVASTNPLHAHFD
jgi:hypothetical protein